jgi:hypothetical protein
MSSSAFRTGISAKGILWGVGLLAAGGLCAWAGSAGWSIRLARIALPGWVMFGAAGLLVIAGVALALSSLKEKFCAACNVGTVAGNAYFPLESEETVVQAVKAVNYALLMELPMVPKNQMKMEVAGEYCPRCSNAAIISVTQWKDFRPTKLVEDHELTGPAAKPAVELIKKHEDSREDADE